MPSRDLESSEEFRKGFLGVIPSYFLDVLIFYSSEVRIFKPVCEFDGEVVE